MQAIRHPGFAFIEILTSCSSFNTTDMNVARLLKAIDTVPADHDPEDAVAALRLAGSESKIHLGVLRRSARPSLEDRFQEIQKKAQRGKLAGIDMLVRQFA